MTCGEHNGGRTESGDKWVWHKEKHKNKSFLEERLSMIEDNGRRRGNKASTVKMTNKEGEIKEKICFQI